MRVCVCGGVYCKLLRVDEERDISNTGWRVHALIRSGACVCVCVIYMGEQNNRNRSHGAEKLKH